VTGSADFSFGTGDFTFEAWARANDVVNTDRKLFYYNQSGTNPVWQVRQAELGLQFNTYSGGFMGVDTNDDVFDDTDWHHVALVRVGTAVTIYVDGVLQDTEGNVHATLGTSTDGAFYVGSRVNVEHWNGAIDDVRIWGHARTGPQILSNMNQELTGSESGLVAYYDFNEGAGQTASDSGPNGYHGTLGSTPGVDANDPAWMPPATPTATPTATPAVTPTPTPTPEPGVILQLIAGVAGLAVLHRRQKRRARRINEAM